MATFQYGDYTIETQLREFRQGLLDVQYSVRAPGGEMSFGHRAIIPRARLGATEEAREEAVAAMARNSADIARRVKLQSYPIDRESHEAFVNAIRSASLDPDGFDLRQVVDDVPLGEGRYVPRRYIFVTGRANQTSRVYISAGEDSWVDEFEEELKKGTFR